MTVCPPRPFAVLLDKIWAEGGRLARRVERRCVPPSSSLTFDKVADLSILIGTNLRGALKRQREARQFAKPPHHGEHKVALGIAGTKPDNDSGCRFVDLAHHGDLRASLGDARPVDAEGIHPETGGFPLVSKPGQGVVAILGDGKVSIVAIDGVRANCRWFTPGI